MKTEVRHLNSRFELRKAGDKRTLTGLAAPYNSLSEDLGNFRERIKPGAFTATLSNNPDVQLTADHDLSVSKVLARTAAGTMALSESQRGLELEADLPNTTFADDVLSLIERGDVNGLSISFSADDDDWTQERGAVIRTLNAVTLGREISVVAAPAYSATSINLRSCPTELRSLLDLFGDSDEDSDSDDDCDCDPNDPDCKCHKDDEDNERSLAALAVILAHKRMRF
jgi:uncharacterized protein